MVENPVDEQVTVITDNERIEGSLFYPESVRLSDALTSPAPRESQFLKIKNPTVYCRRSGAKLTRAPFLMIVREKIVLVLSRSEVSEANRYLALQRIIDKRLSGY